MAAKNEITGDSIASKPPNESYRDGWERAYGSGRERAKNEHGECTKGTDNSESVLEESNRQHREGQ